MSRKIFVLMLVVAALVLGTMSTVAAQDNVLTIWADVTRAPVLISLAEQVEADLGITLDVVEAQDIRQTVLTAGPVGEGPDIFIGAHDWLGELVTNGAVAPIDLSSVADNFVPFTLQAFQWEGTQYGLPYAFENIALVRNVDLVAEAPATWQEVQAIAEGLKEQGVAGLAIQSGDAYHHYPVLTAFGGYLFGSNEDGSWNPSDLGFANDGGLAAAQWLSGMYANELMVPGVGDNEIFALFEEGKLALFVTGPWWSELIVETGINYSIDPLPGAEGGLAQGVPFSGVNGFFVSAFSENTLLAEIFLTEYVATIETMQALFDAGRRPSAYVGVDTSADPNMGGFLAAGTVAISMPNIPEMGATWGGMGTAYTLVSQGEDAAASFQNGQQQIVEAIELSRGTSRLASIPGSLNDEMGCAADWDPACDQAQMTDNGDGTFTLTVTLPAGDFEYKVAINKAWDENYGANGEAGGANIMLSLAAETEVTFTYDDNTKVVTDSVNNP